MDSRNHIPAQGSDIPELPELASDLDGLEAAQHWFQASTRHLRTLRRRLEAAEPPARAEYVDQLIHALDWHLEAHDVLLRALQRHVWLPLGAAIAVEVPTVGGSHG